MYKPKSLRTALTEAVPLLQTNPEKLTLSVESGNVASTLAASLSFENQYTLKLTIADFVDDLSTIFVPIQAWLRIHQADMMATQPGRKHGFTYSAALNDNGSAELTISLQLTERTLVSEVEGELRAEYAPEPQPAEPVTRPMQLYVHGELVSEWYE
ncbi:phage tail protein [Pseudocitrobacter cyperus]|uniref:Phage tail protein n=1 Tax=Pseudocitrobacter cyperus TaxID=3112843 RepID=A0ABV0HJG7_9ENTR